MYVHDQIINNAGISHRMKTLQIDFSALPERTEIINSDLSRRKFILAAVHSDNQMDKANKIEQISDE